MKKSIILAAVAALVLAGCAKNETFVNVADQDAVFFGAYSGRTITKGGPAVDMNLDSLKIHGFGVFATYTQLDTFEVLPSTKGANDNFMANQKVAYAGSEWTYSPIKYWPNPTNGRDADDQLISFFAYAPYTDSTSVDKTYGITGFSTAVAVDDPSAATPVNHVHNFVHYTFAKDKPNVDLMWGYKTKTVDPADPTKVTYTINNNLTRTTDKVRFVFQHLLSKLGGSQEGVDPTTGKILTPDDPGYVANGLVVKANAESVTPTNEFGTATGTKITVSKIVIGSAPAKEDADGDGVEEAVTDIDGTPISYATGAQTGKLDLYTGEFKLDGAAQAIEFKQTITNMIDDPETLTEDESKADSELSERIAEPASFANFAALPKGVTSDKVNVYKTESAPIILVPGTKPVVDIQITYIVRTYDEKLPLGYTDVKQTTWGRIKFPAIKKNTKYNIVMILGINDVKFAAEVADWETGVVDQILNDLNGDGDYDDPGETTDVFDTEIGLPYNL